jgi:hypothetical protein
LLTRLFECSSLNPCQPPTVELLPAMPMAWTVLVTPMVIALIARGAGSGGAPAGGGAAAGAWGPQAASSTTSARYSTTKPHAP